MSEPKNAVSFHFLQTPVILSQTSSMSPVQVRFVNWGFIVIIKSRNKRSANPWSVSTILPQAEGSIFRSKHACTARHAYSASKRDSQNIKSAVTQPTLCKSFPKTHTCPHWNKTGCKCSLSRSWAQKLLPRPEKFETSHITLVFPESISFIQHFRQLFPPLFQRWAWFPHTSSRHWY